MFYLTATIAALALAEAPLPSLQEEPCAQQMSLPNAWLEKSPKFVFVGEIHGTDTSPEAFGDLVCGMLQSHPVIVQLELPAEFGLVIDRYVQTGDEQALEEVLDSWIFTSENYDGRGSSAFVELIRRLRQIKAAGHEITVAGSQPSWRTIEPQHYYELGMAHLWARNAGENPNAINMILVGTYHAKYSPDEERASAASFFRHQDKISLAPCSEGGTASVMLRGSASVMKLADRGMSLKRGVYEASTIENVDNALPRYEKGSFDGYFCAGRPAQASPRAVPVRRQEPENE